jgi:hypothetical protein
VWSDTAVLSKKKKGNKNNKPGAQDVSHLKPRMMLPLLLLLKLLLLPMPPVMLLLLLLGLGLMVVCGVATQLF